MSEVRDHTSSSDDDTARRWGWPPFHRAGQRDRARDEAEQITELRYQWRSACAVTPLGRMIYTPSGVTTTTPLIGRVDLGPPVTFTVQMRPGQTLAHFVAAAPSIASTLHVAELHVTPHGEGWVRVVLLSHQDSSR